MRRYLMLCSSCSRACARHAKYLNINFSILMWPESLLYNLCRNG